MIQETKAKEIHPKVKESINGMLQNIKTLYETDFGGDLDKSQEDEKQQQINSLNNQLQQLGIRHSELIRINTGLLERTQQIISRTIESYSVPNVTQIGSKAFADCVNLTEVSIPSTVTYIGDEAFDGCTNLTTVRFQAVEEVPTLGTDVFPTSNTGFKIYVDSSNVEAFKSAWTTLESFIDTEN